MTKELAESLQPKENTSTLKSILTACCCCFFRESRKDEPREEFLHTPVRRQRSFSAEFDGYAVLTPNQEPDFKLSRHLRNALVRNEDKLNGLYNIELHCSTGETKPARLLVQPLQSRPGSPSHASISISLCGQNHIGFNFDTLIDSETNPVADAQEVATHLHIQKVATHLHINHQLQPDKDQIYLRPMQLSFS